VDRIHQSEQNSRHTPRVPCVLALVSLSLCPCVRVSLCPCVLVSLCPCVLASLSLSFWVLVLLGPSLPLYPCPCCLVVLPVLSRGLFSEPGLDNPSHLRCFLSLLSSLCPSLGPIQLLVLVTTLHLPFFCLPVPTRNDAQQQKSNTYTTRAGGDTATADGYNTARTR
jgi:hypothetical protein